MDGTIVAPLGYGPLIADDDLPTHDWCRCVSVPVPQDASNDVPLTVKPTLQRPENRYETSVPWRFGATVAAAQGAHGP